jgi:hypothetical protein
MIKLLGRLAGLLAAVYSFETILSQGKKSRERKSLIENL